MPDQTLIKVRSKDTITPLKRQKLQDPLGICTKSMNKLRKFCLGQFIKKSPTK
jgi:hypothetical protein